MINNIDIITRLVHPNLQYHLFSASSGKTLGEVEKRLRVLATKELKCQE